MKKVDPKELQDDQVLRELRREIAYIGRISILIGFTVRRYGRT